MKKVWNVQERKWEEVQEGVMLIGTDIVTSNDFVRIWNEVHANSEVTTRHLQMIFKTMSDRKDVYARTSEFDTAVKHELALIYKAYAYEYQGRKQQGGGRDSNVNFTAVPNKYRAGLAAIINGNPAPYTRGAHSTRPSVSSGAHSIVEYHLHADESGRATSARLQHTPLLAFYYSLGHASATYSYHLLTYTYHDDVDDEDFEIPLFGGTHDTILGVRPV